MLYIYDSFARSLAHRPEAPNDEFVVRSDLFNFERVVMGEGDCRGVVGDLHLQLVPSPSGQPEDDALSKNSAEDVKNGSYSEARLKPIQNSPPRENPSTNSW